MQTPIYSPGEPETSQTEPTSPAEQTPRVPFSQRISQIVTPVQLSVIALVVLLGLYGLQHWLREQATACQANLDATLRTSEQVSTTLNHYRALADLKAQDVSRFKNGLSQLAQSNKTLFEAGLSLQEEKRLLEKQWEILTTYLSVNPDLQRIFLMHGDQPLESYHFGNLPLKAYGGAVENAPRIVRIVSKERFAAPERGRSEIVDGKLQWIPPQVGTSIRTNALGEFVMFTNSKLVLHGPPLNEIDHRAFPHLCMSLSPDAARKLYQHSFIGTKIVLGKLTLRPHSSTSASPTTSTAAVSSPVDPDREQR